MKSMVAMAAALAAMAGWAGESAEFQLDTMDGTRTARAVETIAYSTAWNGGGVVNVAVDGVAIKEANVPASGDVVWNAAQASPGTHTLTHVCGGETLTAVFEVVQAPLPPPTLVAESANWSSGSITLRCTDADTSGRAHTYTLQYYDESTGTWKDVSSVQSASATASLTDTAFSSRLDGIPPVKYRVTNETGRASAECVTRNRHAILVGLGTWAYNDKLRPLSGADDVENVYERLHSEGGFNDIHKCVDATARIEDVGSTFRSIAPLAGDICLFYFSTHGGINSKGDAVLCLYDGEYDDMQLAEDIKSLDGGRGDVAKIGIISACHSGALYDNPYQLSSSTSWYMSSGLAQCSANVAWITAADAATTSFGLFDEFMFKYGWKDGWAGDGKSLSLLQLAEYTKRQYDALFHGIIYGDEKRSKEAQIENEPLLAKIIVGKSGTHGEEKAPGVPSNFKASQGKHKGEIRLTWDVATDADVYWIFHKYASYNNYEGRIRKTHLNRYDFRILSIGTDAGEYYDFMDTDAEFPLICVVKAVNGAGVTASQPFEAAGWVDSSWEIRFDAMRGSIVEAWMGEEPQKGTTGDGTPFIVKKMSKGELLQVIDKGPKAERSGFTHAGWKADNGERLRPGMVIDKETWFSADWTAMTQEWLDGHTQVAAVSGGDIATAAAMTAANGCRTVGECYALGIDPEDPNDDLKITDFEMKDGKPVITLNHTTDGSGNSFESRVKTVGKADLSDATEEWREVPDGGDPAMRFFKVSVETP